MNDDETMTIKEVVSICKKVKLANGSLVFDSFGENYVRGKTQQFLDENGMTIYDAESIINSISASDYKEGPVEHYNSKRKHKLWIFNQKYRNMVLYIKLLIYNKRRSVAVISLHD